MEFCSFEFFRFKTISIKDLTSFSYLDFRNELPLPFFEKWAKKLGRERVKGILLTFEPGSLLKTVKSCLLLRGGRVGVLYGKDFLKRFLLFYS